RSPGPGCSATQAAQQLRLDFATLLQHIQGLPATFPALPVELAALCNSLLLDLHLSSHSAEELLPKIDHGLSRGQAADGPPAPATGPPGGFRVPPGLAPGRRAVPPAGACGRGTGGPGAASPGDGRRCPPGFPKPNRTAHLWPQTGCLLCPEESRGSEVHDGPEVSPGGEVSPRRESALPRVPEVFLEAASGLQELARHRDAIAVCEEVVARASELVPERLQVELGCSARAMAGSLRAQAAGVPARQTRESLCCVLWRAAAYLAQGWAWAGLGDPKEAVGLLSRCLNDLLRICFVSTGSSPEEEMERTAIPEAKVLSQIRQLALTGRGAQFLQLERDKEALMDFQHSLCICPDGPTANLYLIHTLWKLGRRQEAAARWQRFCSSPSAPEVPKAERSFPLYLLTYVKQMTFPHAESLTRTMESCLRGSGEGT
uniref:FANCG protein n=1 Tax=Varanus komodoensis TaxID=61221 RepID=A0A8D2LPG0_VARKO